MARCCCFAIHNEPVSVGLECCGCGGVEEAGLGTTAAVRWGGNAIAVAASAGLAGGEAVSEGAVGVAGGVAGCCPAASVGPLPSAAAAGVAAGGAKVGGVEVVEAATAAGREARAGSTGKAARSVEEGGAVGPRRAGDDAAETVDAAEVDAVAAAPAAAAAAAG